MKRLLLFISCGALLHSYSALLQAQTAGPGIPAVYKVSQLIPAAHAKSGCNWSTGLRTGGSACYDDSSFINPIAALATAGNPLDIVFDVSIGIGSPIFLPASPYVTLEGLSSQSTGIVVLTGSNSTAICNQYPGFRTGCSGGTDGFTPTPPTAGSVIIKHLGVNGNRGIYPNSNSSTNDGRCASWCLGISLANLQYYELNDVYIYDAPTYASLTSNVDRQVYRNVRMVTAHLFSGNTDGIHMDGPCGTFDVEGGYFALGDDSIAVNLPEGYGGSCGGGTINNITYAGALSGFRTYSNSGGYTLGPVMMSNLVGFLSNPSGADTTTLLRLGYNSPFALDEIQSIKVTNANITLSPVSGTASLVSIQQNVGELSLNNVTWNSPVSASPWLNFTTASTTVSNYTCTNCTIYRTPTGNAAAFWGTVPNTDTIKRAECNGCSVVNQPGQTYPALPYAWDVRPGGVLGTYVMTAHDPSLNPTFTNGNEWPGITAFYGAGISSYYRNTVFSNLPPATYCGLSVSVGDSNANGVLGAVEGGGSPGHYAMEWSNCTNWTSPGNERFRGPYLSRFRRRGQLVKQRSGHIHACDDKKQEDQHKRLDLPGEAAVFERQIRLWREDDRAGDQY